MALELVEKPTRTNGSNGSNGTPTITIDTDKPCVLCGEKGAMENKLCLKCTAKSLTDYSDPPFKYNEADQQFAVAPEAEEIGKKLIQRHHQYLEVYEIRVEFVFLKNTPIKSGKEIWGRAKKVSSLNAWLALPEEERKRKVLPDAFFVIELSWEVWRQLPKAKRVALVDHELSHCGINEKAKPTLNGHDCEEFVSVIYRHGMWTNDVKQLLDAAKASEENPLFAEHVGDTTEEDIEE